MKIALITGSSGLVGSESVEFFINKKFMKDYPNFKIKYNIEEVIEELISKI